MSYETQSKNITDTQYLRKEKWLQEEEKHPTNGASTSSGRSQKTVWVHKYEEDGEQKVQDLLNDPYPIQECLQLLPEEAVFLSFALGCLVVFDENDKPLNIDVSYRMKFHFSNNVPIQIIIFLNL